MKDASIQIKSSYNEGLNRMNAARPFFTNKTQMGVMSHSFKPRTGKAGAGRSWSIQGQPALHSKFQASQGRRVRPCLKKK